MTIQFCIRIPKEQVAALDERAKELNKHIPEAKLTASKILTNITKDNVKRYVSRQERLGYDHLIAEDIDPTVSKLLKLLEEKSYDAQTLSHKLFLGADGLSVVTEMHDITEALLAIGAENKEKLLSIASSTTCEKLLDILENNSQKEVAPC